MSLFDGNAVEREALGHLRTDRRTSSIPVLALTAQAMHGDRERFLAAGFDGYIAKPVNIVALVHTVHDAVLDRASRIQSE